MKSIPSALLTFIVGRLASISAALICSEVMKTAPLTLATILCHMTFNNNSGTHMHQVVLMFAPKELITSVVSYVSYIERRLCDLR